MAILRYQNYKAILSRVIRLAKAMETENKLTDADNDCRKLWGILNEVVDRKQLKHKIPSRFTINGVSISQISTIANGFNHYFATIGQDMANSTPEVIGYKKYIKRSYGMLELARPDSEIIRNITHKQQPKLSCGLDTKK